MAECIENKHSRPFGGVNTSNNATFRLDDLKSNFMFLLRKIITFCHPEFISGSQGHEILNQVQNDIGIRHTFKKAFAFTLAETLIVMGIIGVVAALTIPNLNASTADKEKIAKVKKVYSNLDDALGRAQAVYGPMIDWSEGFNATRAGERITEFMKVSKNCKTATGCTAISPKSINGNNYATLDTNTNVYKFVMADGTSVAFIGGSPSIVVDIDGREKGMNQIGKDLFIFRHEYQDGSNATVVPYRPANFSDYLTDLTSNVGMYASGWVVDYDNMDYLKLNSSKKCPNNVTPTELSPRCK